LAVIFAEQEIAAFDGLKTGSPPSEPFGPRGEFHVGRDSIHYARPVELTKLEAASVYEERLLFLLIRLRNPQAHGVRHPQPVPLILVLLPAPGGIPGSHARARL
jgi:hypothetical protein